MVRGIRIDRTLCNPCAEWAKICYKGALKAHVFAPYQKPPGAGAVTESV
jgi:hypothetical protein